MTWRGGDPELYDAFATAMDRADQGRFRRWLIDQIPPGGGTALDVGCGPGRHAVALSGAFDGVLAVDPDPGMIALAADGRPRSKVAYEVRGLFDLDPATDGLFGMVVCTFVAHHAGDPARVLGRLRSLVAPGGRLVVVDVVDTGGWSAPGWHVERAFAAARAVHDAGGVAEEVAAVVRQLLDEAWLAQAVADRPLTPEVFDRTYRAALPGVKIVDLGSAGTIRGAVWTAPAGA